MEEKYDYIVYKTTDLSNGMIYVGYDSYNRDWYFGSGTYIIRSVKKRIREYVENVLNEKFIDEKKYTKFYYRYKDLTPLFFKKEILTHYQKQEDMVKDEPNWIKKFNATDRSIGYNIIDTETWGDTWNNLTEDDKKERSKKISDNTKIGMLAVKDYLTENVYPIYYVKVYQYDLKGNFIREYESEIEAYRITGIVNICTCCKGELKSAGGFIWSYTKLTDDEIKERVNVVENKFSNNKIPVIQTDMNDNFIKEYKSTADAVRETGVLHIWHCCNELQQSAGGSKWKYKNRKESRDHRHKENDILKMREFHPKNKRIEQLDKDDNVIAKWNSISEAARKTNIDRVSIIYCCKGIRITAGGSKWRYEKI